MKLLCPENRPKCLCNVFYAYKSRATLMSACRNDDIIQQLGPFHSQSLFQFVQTSGGANAAKEPGHFEVRTSSSQVTRMQLFSSKKVDDLL